MNREIRVLIVEDNPDDAELIVIQLERSNYNVFYRRVDTAIAMQAALDSQPWDIVLADYAMPQFNAIQALKLLKAQALDTPFIVVSGSIGEEIAAELMRTGAHDYLLKQNLIRLVPAIERELREAKIRVERKQALERVESLAFHDDLTGLPNRNSFLNTLQEHIQAVKQSSAKRMFSVIFIDLDQYRTIRYSFGHVKAEQLLIEVAHRLRLDLCSEVNYLARVGEDEFAILATHLEDSIAAEHVVNRIHEIIDPPFDLEGFVIYASVTIGLVTSAVNLQEPEEFVRAAETACNLAKQRELQHSMVVYSYDMQAQAIEQLQLETELRQAVINNQLQLFYQPIFSLPSKIIGFEALIRWQHPTRKWVPPDKFIPIAEKTGLIIPLGDWIIETACQQAKEWQIQLGNYLPLSIAVNLSGIQLREPDVVDKISQQCQSLDVQQIRLKLEITESVLMHHREVAMNSLDQLQTAGIELCIDDFGTGYSSLSYLHFFPINTLKVDRSFVSRMLEDNRNFGIVRAIIALAKTLNLDVIAEGIETQAQRDSLQSLNCGYGQGYFFSRPMPAAQVPNWLRQFYSQS